MNLSGKQIFEFVLQCGVALLIEIDRNGVGCRPQLHGKTTVGGVGLLFVRSYHLLSSSRCGGSVFIWFGLCRVHGSDVVRC